MARPFKKISPDSPLAQWLTRMRWSAQQLAALFEVHPRTIWAWATGREPLPYHVGLILWLIEHDPNAGHLLRQGWYYACHQAALQAERGGTEENLLERQARLLNPPALQRPWTHDRDEIYAEDYPWPSEQPQKKPGGYWKSE